MAVSHEFPAAAAKPLVEGYCQDFVSLAASLAQTLEQVEMRRIDLQSCRDVLLRTERGMRGLADAIHDLLERGLQSAPAEPPPAAPPASAPAAAPAAPEQSPLDPRHQLRGNTQTMPLLSVMQFLSRVRKSGTLHIDVGDEHITFDFVNGVIEASGSDQSAPDERLGNILIAMFPAQRERLQPVLQRLEQRGNLRRLGTEVVQAGAASNGQVIEALEKQVQARYQRVVSAPIATYAFEEGERVPGDGRIRIRPFELEFAIKMQGR